MRLPGSCRTGVMVDLYVRAIGGGNGRLNIYIPLFFLNPHDCWLLSAVSLPFVGVTVTQLILIHCMSFLSSTHGTIGFCIVTRRLQLCKGLFIPSSNMCQLYCSCASS